MASVVQSRYLPRRVPGSGILRRIAAYFTAPHAAQPPLFGDSADLIAKARRLRTAQLKHLVSRTADR